MNTQFLSQPCCVMGGRLDEKLEVSYVASVAASRGSTRTDHIHAVASVSTFISKQHFACSVNLVPYSLVPLYPWCLGAMGYVKGYVSDLLMHVVRMAKHCTYNAHSVRGNHLASSGIQQ